MVFKRLPAFPKTIHVFKNKTITLVLKQKTQKQCIERIFDKVGSKFFANIREFVWGRAQKFYNLKGVCSKKDTNYIFTSLNFSFFLFLNLKELMFVK